MLPLRAHPRVILTLRVIAATPGLSSRQVSERVNTQGDRHDISDLFTLLERRGLIENTRAGRGARDRTAWRLTLYGRRALELLADARARRASRRAAQRLPQAPATPTVRAPGQGRRPRPQERRMSRPACLSASSPVRASIAAPRRMRTAHAPTSFRPPASPVLGACLDGPCRSGPVGRRGCRRPAGSPGRGDGFLLVLLVQVKANRRSDGE